MPNSEFTVVIDRTNGQFIGVEHQSDHGQDHGGHAAGKKVSLPGRSTAAT
jgi:hypothetical protein